MRKISPAYLLNSFLTKGFFILNQESELVDGFLGKYDIQTLCNNKPYGMKRKCIQLGRKK